MTMPSSAGRRRALLEADGFDVIGEADTGHDAFRWWPALTWA